MAEKTQLVVVGAGPGGYPAAFLAADLGMEVTLIDEGPNPGGVCTFRGCIPSKALLHAAALIHETETSSNWGVTFAPPKIELARLREWKDQLVAKLTGNLGEMAKRRKVRFKQGRARFTGPSTLEISRSDAKLESLEFANAIIATGSVPAMPGLFNIGSPRVMDSTAALDLPDIPARLLVVGGGYIGLELGTVYAAIGSKVSVVEMTDALLPGADRDLVRPLAKSLESRMEAILLKTKVTALKEKGKQIIVTLEDEKGAQSEQSFDRVLVSVGRKPNSTNLGLEATRVELDAQGFIRVDAQRKTAEPLIFAIGDVAGQPMLAHKATHEARAAVEAIAGHKAAFAPNAIPAVVFTDPEIAWCGVTEAEAKAAGLDYESVRFPWSASGRAASMERGEGVTKLIIDRKSHRILGVGICGHGAGEMISEGVLAIEMAATAEDLRSTIHPHPTLSETLMEAAELFYGQSPHLFKAKRSG